MTLVIVGTGTDVGKTAGPIQALPWNSLAMGFDATHERSGDGDGDLAERQGEDGGEDTVIRMAARQAVTPGRWLMGPIHVLLWISRTMGFDATRERSGEGDSDLDERQGTSALRRHRREDGGEDTGEDTGGDSGEDTREEDKEERRRGSSTTTTTGRVDQDARPAGESSRSVVDAVGAGAANRAVEHGVDAYAGDAGGEGARAGDLAP